MLLAGRWVGSGERATITSPADPDTPLGYAALASSEQLDEAIREAERVFEGAESMAAYERSRILHGIAAGIRADRENLGRLIALEAGKPIRDALGEVDRATLTFRLAAEEAERIGGEVIPLDLAPASRDRVGITRRFPIGPIAAITPFNFPLNLAAHKIAPAIAAGNPIVLKPPTKAPLTMLRVGQIINDSGIAPGFVSILPMSRSVGDEMVADPRFRLLTFTGSPSVGWAIKQRAGKKKVVLELGGNAAVVVDRTADLEWATSRILTGSFAYAGQMCISVQRIMVHEDVAGDLMSGLVEGAGKLRVGDPTDPLTDVGPMISAGEAERARQWVTEATELGGEVLLGGQPDGAYFPPTILTGVPSHAKVCAAEVFAPVVVISTFRDFSSALQAVNESDFGLQAGVFTNDLRHAWDAFNGLEVGGVIINDVPTYRIDNMPYGGVKDSGQGREGIRWAIEDMTELRLMVLAG